MLSKHAGLPENIGPSPSPSPLRQCFFEPPVNVDPGLPAFLIVFFSCPEHERDQQPGTHRQHHLEHGFGKGKVCSVFVNPAFKGAVMTQTAKLSGSELRAEVMANYLRHEHLPDGTFLSENARYQQTYGMLSEEGVIIQQSYNKSQAASFLAA